MASDLVGKLDHHRIVQLLPWRGVLLALTASGEIYRLGPDSDRTLPTYWAATRLFPGIPKDDA